MIKLIIALAFTGVLVIFWQAIALAKMQSTPAELNAATFEIGE